MMGRYCWNREDRIDEGIARRARAFAPVHGHLGAAPLTVCALNFVDYKALIGWNDLRGVQHGGEQGDENWMLLCLQSGRAAF